MRIAIALLALATTFVVSCEREPKLSTERLPISFEHTRTLDEVAQFVGTGRQHAAIQMAAEADRESVRLVSVAAARDRQVFPHLRSASPRELHAYVKQHPEDAARYQSLCARGAFVETSNGYRGHLAHSGKPLRGQGPYAVLKNGCRWVLLVE